jgi:ABC-type polysaccharide/polyol phosphate export permease
MLWIIDPIFQTFLYGVFIAVLRGKSDSNFGVFVLIGITHWNFFNKTVKNAITAVKKNRVLLHNFKIPISTIILIPALTSIFQYAISSGLLIIMMFIFQVKISFYILFFPLYLALFLILTFSISLIMMHIGVYFSDIKILISMFFKILFFASGIIFPLDQIIGRMNLPDFFRYIFLYANPITFFITEMRKVLMYSEPPDYLISLLWVIAIILLTFFAVKLTSRYGKDYGKFVK